MDDKSLLCTWQCECWDYPYKRVWTTKDDKSMYFALKNDGTIEYKKGLEFSELAEIKHKAEGSDAAINRAATTMSFGICDEIELELPTRLPKPKREGYR